MPHIRLNLRARYGIARLRGRTESAPARVFCEMLRTWDAELAATERSMLKKLSR